MWRLNASGENLVNVCNLDVKLVPGTE